MFENVHNIKILKITFLWLRNRASVKMSISVCREMNLSITVHIVVYGAYVRAPETDSQMSILTQCGLGEIN